MNQGQNMDYGPTEVCKMVGISKRQLDYWILIGIISPRIEARGLKKFKRFIQYHIKILKEVKILTDEGFMVNRALDRLKKDHPELFYENNLSAGGEKK